jgi:hypothetical protein
MTGTAEATGWRCRWCRRPVRHEGGGGAPDALRKAVHADTGEEPCEDGAHLAAPIDAAMAGLG